MTKGEAIRIVAWWAGQTQVAGVLVPPPLDAIKRILQELKTASRSNGG